MKHINRKIYLEPFKSRQCWNIKSFDDNGTSCNYGLIPFDIKSQNGKRITYRTMMDMYFWLKKYKNFIKKSKCHVREGNEILYDSAIDYYNNEVKIKSNELRQYYLDLDTKRAEYESYIGSLDTFEEWVQNNAKTIEHDYVNYEELDDYPNCITLPIILTTSIDDIGEYSIFYNEWEEGKHYNTDDLVFYDNEIYKMIGKNNTYGSIYSKKYRESYFANKDVLTEEDREWYDKSNGLLENDSVQWENVTNNFFDGNKGIEHNVPNVSNLLGDSGYAIKNGEIVVNPSYKNMYDEYSIIRNEDLGFFVINNTIYDVLLAKYISYKNDKYIVRRFKASNLNIGYCVINNMKYYSSFEGNAVEYFIIDGNKYMVSDNEEEFIIYENKDIQVHNKSSVTITTSNINRTYFKIDGYVDVDGAFYYIKANNVITFKYNENGDKNISYNIDTHTETPLGSNNPMAKNTENAYSIEKDLLKVFKPYIIFNDKGILSGITDSKLTCLYTKPIASDNVGNQLKCAFIKDDDGNVIQPNQGEYLDFICNVGNYSNLSSIGEKEYWGNLLTNLEFYYLNKEGKKTDDLTLKIDKYDNKIIDKINALRNKVANDDNIYKTLYCDITYYIGAILEYTPNGYKYKKNGVKYVDKVYLTEENANFYKTDHIMLIIKYFDIHYDMYVSRFNEYSNKEVIVNQSYYQVNIKPTNKAENSFRNEFDGMISSPIFREEYKFGSSSLEKIKSDIYINRGISNAFENHLKLMEINSLESLEQYGNGFYNIIKN